MEKNLIPKSSSCTSLSDQNHRVGEVQEVRLVREYKLGWLNTKAQAQAHIPGSTQNAISADLIQI